MPKSLVSVAPDLSTDAGFRAVITAVKTGIEAMGWTQTSDTGQINFSTVLKPSSNNQVRGFAIWQATDALSATKPMLLRLDFGSGGGGAGVLRITPSAGSATDGAGTFVGNAVAISGLDGPNPSTATTYECLFSGDTDRLVFVLFDNYPTQSSTICIGIERSHDNTGADTDVGIFMFSTPGTFSNAQRHQFCPYAGSIPAQNNLFMGAVPNSATSTLIGVQVGLFPIFPFYVIALNPSKQVVTYMASDISGNTQITASMYGATRTFLTTRNCRGAEGRHWLAIRWET
jgi:hypothetical protein